MSSNQPIFLSGLASGLDTSSIVDALMQIERQPRTRLDTKKSQITQRQSVMRDLKTRLTTLKLAADSLRSPGLFADTQSLDSSDPSKVSATRISGAGTGGSQVLVSRLASSQQRTYAYAKDPTGETTIDFGNEKKITIAAGSEIDDVVSAINSSSGSPVYAASITDPSDSTKKLLVLSSKTPGSDGDFSVQLGTTTTGLVEDTAKAKAQPANLNDLNAEYTVDGGAPRYSKSNIVSDAIPGLQLTFKATGTVTITVGSPAPDHAAIKGEVKDFINQYNSVVDFLGSKVKEQRVVNPQTAADNLKGLFFGDALLTGIQSRLRIAVTSPVGSDPSLNLLSQIGISTGATTGGGVVNQDSVAGKLTLDEAKLDQMLDTNPNGVKKLLGAMTNVGGLGQAIDGVLDPEVGSGLDFDTQITQMDNQLRDLADQMASMDERLSRTESRLKAQFAAMETALSSSQNQQQWLAGQIAGMMNNR